MWADLITTQLLGISRETVLEPMMWCKDIHTHTYIYTDVIEKDEQGSTYFRLPNAGTDRLVCPALVSSTPGFHIDFTSTYHTVANVPTLWDPMCLVHLSFVRNGCCSRYSRNPSTQENTQKNKLQATRLYISLHLFTAWVYPTCPASSTQGECSQWWRTWQPQLFFSRPGMNIRNPPLMNFPCTNAHLVWGLSS